MIVCFGDIVLAAGGSYSSKPRPVLVFQNSNFPTGESVIVVPFTSFDDPSAHYRVSVSPTQANGLEIHCWLEVDKVSAIRQTWIGRKIGHLETEELELTIDLARQLMSQETYSLSRSYSEQT